MPLLRDPELPTEPVDTFILESTYGNRNHESLDNALETFAATIRDVIEQGGKIIVPAFSLGRTQLLVYLLHRMTDQGKIPR
jgi:metallo-beta-lactamase family protein